MKSFFSALIILTACIAPALAATPVWGQCGGENFTGDTTCAEGSYCQFSNQWYSQCLPGTNPNPGTSSSVSSVSSATPTSSQPVSTTSSAPNPTSTKFKYFGVNQSCAEFGENVLPGVLGTHYTWPSPSSIDFFVGKGFNTFRVAFKLERLSPDTVGLASPNFDAAYLSGLTETVNYITLTKGAFAIIEPHNYARYYGNVITNYADFSAWWENLATIFVNNDKVIFDVINEPHSIPATDALALNQAAINGIRSAGATQLILVEGTAWTGAWTWISSGNSAAFTSITDPLNNIAIEMHQYLDTDGSGTSPTCVSPTIGAERLQAATAWLQQTGFKGFLGELGAGSNDDCISAVKGALQYMQESGVWIGALWWAAGPWWGDYFQSIEPPNGASIPRILPEALLPFV
ncbi:glycosyl hydrolase 5 (cellulase A) family protein [Pleurotus pulmonarius]